LRLNVVELTATPGKATQVNLDDEGVPKALDFTPDSKGILVGFADHSVRVVDPTNGQTILPFVKGKAPATQIRVSPDGQTALVAFPAPEGEKRLRAEVVLYSMITGEVVRRTEVKAPVTVLAYLNGGKRALVGEGDNTVRQIEVETGKELNASRWDCAFSYPAVISSDGKTALVSSPETLDQIDVATGKKLKPTIRAGPGQHFAEASFTAKPDRILVIRNRLANKGEKARYQTGEIVVLARDNGAVLSSFTPTKDQVFRQVLCTPDYGLLFSWGVDNYWYWKPIF
jgi:WD40 repeat protein